MQIVQPFVVLKFVRIFDTVAGSRHINIGSMKAGGWVRSQMQWALRQSCEVPEADARYAETRAARASPRDVSRVPRLRSVFLPPRPPRLPPTTRSLFGGRKLPLVAVMPLAYSLPTDLSPATVVNASSLLRIVALALISGAAIASRLFAVINFESVIHEL